MNSILMSIKIKNCNIFNTNLLLIFTNDDFSFIDSFIDFPSKKKEIKEKNLKIYEVDNHCYLYTNTHRKQIIVNMGKLDLETWQRRYLIRSCQWNHRHYLK